MRRNLRLRISYGELRNKTSLIIFVLSLLFWSFAFGVAVEKFRVFPYKIIVHAQQGASKTFDILTGKLPWYYRYTDRTKTVIVHDQQAVSEGLTLVSGLTKEGKVHVQVLTRDGEVVHQWLFDWFDNFWPNPVHIPEDQLPQARPATQIHGLALLKNGDLLFNMDGFGLSRVNLCGNVIWQLASRTHHALDVDEQENIWVPSQNRMLKPTAKFPNYRPPFEEYTVLKVAPDGKILREISIFDLLINNRLHGLLYMWAKQNQLTVVSGDTLHLNDVETFPAHLQPGVFGTGDVLISLRNIHTVLVFNSDTLNIKYLSVGKTVRQHDPDFVDGNRISVFDNNNVAPESHSMNSRIVVIDARNDQVQVIYSGSSEHPFYTDIMGKHQWLPNGNILVTESKRGRAFEIDANGKLLWEYFNLVDKGRLALVTEAERLPSFFTPSFFMEGRRTCDKVPVAEVSAPKELSHLELEPDDSQKSPLQRKYLLRR